MASPSRMDVYSSFVEERPKTITLTETVQNLNGDIEEQVKNHQDIVADLSRQSDQRIKALEDKHATQLRCTKLMQDTTVAKQVAEIERL